jgi:acyl carrier protein
MTLRYVLILRSFGYSANNKQLQGVHPKILYRVLCSAQKSQMQRSQSSPKLEVDNAPEAPLLVAATCTDVHERNPSSDSSLDRLVDIVSEESGIERKELNDDVELAGLGVDSLLSLLIASRLKDDLDFDPGSGITFFDDYRTLGQLKGAYAKSKGFSPDTISSSNSERKEMMDIETSLTLSESGCSTGATSPHHSPERPVTSLVLQRASALDSKILFLFPDGSGSASSYTSLPPISPHLTVVALLSPYRHDPENMACTLDALLVSYIMEIKRRQPADGYTLGGWSSGGVFAFRAAQLLLQQGDTIRDLLLLDSPPLRVGGGLGQLPERFYKHCRDVGIFGQIASSGEKTTSGKHPAWLTSHFKATVNLLAAHRATPLTIPHGYSKPRVSLCWAGKCALDGIRYKAFEMEAGDSEDVRFLAEPRRDFGPGAWADLFPGITCHVTLLEQWDHFNMMVGDGAKDLSHFFASRI